MSKRKKQTVSKGRQVVKNYKGNLSLVIPCYNESKRISSLFNELRKFKELWGSNFEVILINDGSSDNTLDILEKGGIEFSEITGIQLRIINLEKNKGKGYALKEGVKIAEGDHILTLDADMSMAPIELINWLQLIQSENFPDNEILIASRNHINSTADTKLVRRIAGFIFNFFIQMITSLKVSDTQCGFKLYPSNFAKKLFSELMNDGWVHDVEILYNASMNGLIIREMPVKVEHHEGSKVSLLKDSFKMLFQVIILAFKLNWKYFIGDPIQAKFLKDVKTESPLYRLIFVILVFLSLCFMPLLSFDYGYTGDELVQNVYGEKVLSYFESGGQDKSALNYKNLYFYGGLFDYTAALVNKYIGGIDPFSIRHLLNAIVGALLFWFTGLLGKEITGSWKIGLLSMVSVLLYPRIFGHSMNNPKDIPFAAAYIFTLLFIFKFLKELPRPSIKTTLFLVLGISFAINFRVGGILLIAYFGFFLGVIYLWKEDLRKRLTHPKVWIRLISIFLFIGITGYFGGLLYWPYALEDPINNPFKSLSEMSNFSISITLLFEGMRLWSDQLPWYYIPKWMLIGSPIFLLLGITFSFASFFINKDIETKRYLVLLLFSAIFPVTYAVIKGSSLYDGMRHFLFVVPILAILSSWGWSVISKWKKNPTYYFTFNGLLFVGMLLPLFFMIRNHPYQTVYFNELSGGSTKAFGNYEMDYWMNSMKEMCEWLVENDEEIKSGLEKTILTNCFDPVSYYMNLLAPQVKVSYVRYSDRHSKDGDYFLFLNRFIDPGYLKSGVWPPGDLVHQIEVDGAPIAALTKTDPNQYAVNGKIKEDQQDYMGALESYKLAVAQDPRDELAWSGLAKLYLDTQQFDAAKAAIDQLLTLSQSDFGTWYLLGQYHYNRGQAGEALKAFQTCRDLNYKQNIVYYYLALIHLNLGELPKVLENVEAYDKTGGNIAQVYEIGISAASQLSATAASKYFSAKKAFFEGKAQEAYRLAGEALATDPGYDLAREFIGRFNTN